IGPAAASKVTPTLEAMLRGSDPTARRSAAFVAGCLGSGARDVIPALFAAWQQPGDAADAQQEAATIANALGRIGPAAVPALLDAARDGVLDSERVATALSAIGPAAVEPLVDALDSNSAAVRAAAARGLGGIDSPTT